MKLHVFPSALLVAQSAALAFAQRLAASTGEFHVVLSGGRTPKALFEILATMDLPWDRLQVWMGDERLVPMDDPASNYGAADEAWLRHVPIPAAQLHPMVTDPQLGVEEAARIYEATLPDCDFDLVWLGLGSDAHTASLFPGRPEVHETKRDALPGIAPVVPFDRVTLSAPRLRRAKEVEFLITGADKMEALGLLRSAPENWDLAPSQAVARHAPSVTLRVDEAALGAS